MPRPRSVLHGGGSRRGNDGNIGRGSGRGRGRQKPQFQLVRAPCVIGGKLGFKSLPIESVTYGVGESTCEFIKIRLSAEWLQRAVLGKCQHNIVGFLPTFRRIRAMYLALLEDPYADLEDAAA